MKNLLLSFSVLLCGASGLLAQNKINFVEYDLPNGLHVILHEDHTTPNVIVSVMYHVGSKNENPERTGFAHFFEHLLFEGSENIGRGEFAKYVEKAGGTLNANTSWDRTFYYDLVPSNQLELGLWLESERMMHAKVEKTGIETQRQVVKEERRLRIENQPYGTVLEEIFKRAYTKHPYRWPIIGSMAHLDAAQEADYVNFYQTFYVPNNAILSIAGDLNIEETKKLVEKFFKDIPRGTREIPRPTEVEPALAKEIRDTIYDNIQLPAVIQAYRIPAQGTPDFYAVSMMAQLLSQGQSSRFNKVLVDEQQKALQVFAFPLNLEHPGLNVNFGITNIGVNPAEVEKGMDAEVEKLQNDLMTEDEFQKLRNQIEAEFISNKRGIASLAESLANYRMYLGDANLINSEIDRYMKVTREDIRRVAKQYFSKNNRVVLYYLPKSSKKA